MTPAPLPVEDLRDLGEKLQQAIVLTRMRVALLPASRVKARATRVVEHADTLFRHLTQAVMATSSLTGFLAKAMGVTVDDLFMYTGRPKIARGVAYAGVAAANDAVRQALSELSVVNVAIDKEVNKHDKA